MILRDIGAWFSDAIENIAGSTERVIQEQIQQDFGGLIALLDAELERRQVTRWDPAPPPHDDGQTPCAVYPD